MKRLFPVFALTALAAATVATAQQTPSSAQPPASTSRSQSQTTPPSDPRKADKEALMRNCIAQTKTDHPGATANDVKDYCMKRVESSTPPQQSPRD
jgi:hypothetical protein